jgi:hypothetical protein
MPAKWQSLFFNESLFLPTGLIPDFLWHFNYRFKVITFPECLEQLFDNCLGTLNDQIQLLGLSPYELEIVVHNKRTIDQPGYNKVVIITDMLGELVTGQLGDGIVSYPFLWDDSVLGQRYLSVDSKWNCFGYSPEACCDQIKQSTF